MASKRLTRNKIFNGKQKIGQELRSLMASKRLTRNKIFNGKQKIDQEQDL